MVRTVGQSLGVKFSVAIAVMTLVMGFLIIFLGYQLYSQQSIESYSQRGSALINATAKIIDWDGISGYAETLEEDAAYDQTLADMRILAEGADVEYLYILKPVDEKGAIYIYDTDTSEDHCELGEYIDWESAFTAQTDALLRGEEVEPFVEETEWGWLLSIYEPFYDSKGEFAGYLGVDYTADTLVAEQNAYIKNLALAAVVVAIAVTIAFLLILRRLILKPINQIVNAADQYVVSNGEEENDASNSISKLNIQTRDELQTLDESLKFMDTTIKEYVENLAHEKHRAETDSMTGLFNRKSFVDQVNDVLSREPKATNAFMMIDLDNFKGVNDTYGHAIGDDVIIACVSAIRQSFRSTDLMARMGGDEFAVFCIGPIGRDIVEIRAQQLCDTVRSMRIQDSITFTISVGVVYFDANEIADYQELYLQADNALYETKEQGRDGFIVNDYVPGGILPEESPAEQAEVAPGSSPADSAASRASTTALPEDPLAQS